MQFCLTEVLPSAPAATSFLTAVLHPCQHSYAEPSALLVPQVEKVAKQVAAVLPQTGAKPGEARPESHSAAKWNVHPTSTKVTRLFNCSFFVTHACCRGRSVSWHP